MKPLRTYNDRIRVRDADADFDLFIRIDTDGDMWLEDGVQGNDNTHSVLIPRRMAGPVGAAILRARRF